MPTSVLSKPPTEGTDYDFSDGEIGQGQFSSVTDGSSFGDSFGSVETIKSTGRRRSIRKQDIAEVTAQLAIMVRSGVDISSALDSLSSQCEHPALADVLRTVQETVLAGSSLSEALRRHPKVFEPTYIATVAAGEASGRMSEVLQQLSQMQRNELKSSRSITTLLTYPVLLMMVSGSVLGALILFVLPRFTTLFAQYDMPLPVITQVLIALADELTTRWWFWLPLVAVSIGSLLWWRTTEGGRVWFDRFWLLGPVVGPVCQSACVGRMCRLLGLMLDNGVPLLESLRLTRYGVRNSLYQKLLGDLERSVVNGQGLGDVLRRAEIIPVSAREMILTAERTGNLSEVTGLLGEYYGEEAESKTRQLVGLLEPIITVVMGAVVATVVLAVMLPVFDLSTFSGGGH